MGAKNTTEIKPICFPFFGWGPLGLALWLVPRYTVTVYQKVLGSSLVHTWGGWPIRYQGRQKESVNRPNGPNRTDGVEAIDSLPDSSSDVSVCLLRWRLVTLLVSVLALSAEFLF